MLKLLWLHVFMVLYKLAISSEESDGLGEKRDDIQSGMNFYGEIADPSILRRPEILFFDPCNCSERFCFEDAETNQCNYSSPYRNYDGSCNNPYVPSFGMAGMCFLRLTNAYYEGKEGLRNSVKGGLLPNPRDISVRILKDKHRPTEDVTALFTLHGQIIAHDMTKAVQPQIDCCSESNADNPECIPITVRKDDPFYSQFNKTCLNSQRSEECDFCKKDHREQKNTATPVLDVNLIYGVDEERVQQLRANDGSGKLKNSGRNNGYLLPAGKDKADPFCPKGQDSNCFFSGDERVNMHASLTSLSTILMREHNRLDTELKKLNPHWGAEKLFQESRKILIGEHQCITYKWYLPLLLGSAIVEAFDLTVKQGPRGTTYFPNVILGIFQEFTAGAFRLHSMVPTDIGLSSMTFKNTFGNPTMIREGGILNITSGSYQVSCEKYDRWIITDLSNYAGFQPGRHYGSDLSAADIKRGRDHGLPPYVDVVKFCSGGTVTILDFQDLYKLSLMSRKSAMLLKNMYKDVKDVDMWVGLLLEYHYPGSLLGPSAVCITVIQFYSAQKGDRHYFDHDGHGAPFTPDQRSALKQCSLARIICDNTQNSHITQNPFLQPSNENPDVSCEEIPKIDLTPWKEGTDEDNSLGDC